ncbi:D-aminoacylase [Pseudomonas sp. CCI4.2]|uniref:N-acyl-D-amino-acid deacylase family protein n=1 Tax=Pseudomonas sp. CCI4.2 TaxID=3048620 RepID=UPI002AC97CE8|nr:D-aminoacylase [Pseudomonas sp. CCI4.2]MEB0091383.1 D-aminoacylase [Pseudomonas sp. CCI4.2]WPX52431.1 D-aminoacylase [Pseudomonas sp. CCI4.2]
MHNHLAFDIIIEGGTVIDGSKAPRFMADVGIREGKIGAIGDLSACDAAQRINAHGKVVAPGFIDSHTHDDQAVLSKPDMTFKISQGVTTVVTGNCGISIAPLRPDSDLPSPLNLLEDTQNPRFSTFKDYLDALRQSPSAVNVAAMVGHSTLRVMTMSSLERAADPAEIIAMSRLLDEALAAGAIGISTGTYYPPAAHAPTQEIIDVCQPLKGSGALYVTHMRDEADNTLTSLEETFFIGRELNSPVVISHHKLMRPQNFGKSAITLPIIQKAMKCQCISLDCYPYNASSTMLHTDPNRLQGRILISSSEPHPEQAGRDLDDIAAEWAIDKVDAARRLQPASAIYFGMDEADVQNILAFDETMIGSDGIPSGEKPHPRLWGTFPRVLGHYSRDLKLFPLETAVWKMTGLTARNFNLPQRGTLVIGNYADIVIFDPLTVRDAADYENSTAPAKGIEVVIVNGEVSWLHGTHLGTRAGQVITRAMNG